MSASAIAVATEPASAAGAPSAPATPVAIPGSTYARVTWAAPADNGSPITQYVVTPFIGTTAQTPHVYGSTAVTELVTGLASGVTFTFKVKARNAIGLGAYSPPSNPVTVGAPVAPAAPLGAPGVASARLNWLQPAANGSAITGYVVTPYIGAVAQTARTFNTVALVETVPGLTNGVSYRFRVAAKNAVGTGPQSALSAVVKPVNAKTIGAVMNTTIGQPILVNAYGMTLYMFVPDGAATTSSVTGNLRVIWPYSVWSGPVTVGAGLTASLAVAYQQPDRTRLVSYNGHLLYTFASDHVPGDATGQGLAQFFVVDASGNKIP